MQFVAPIEAKSFRRAAAFILLLLGLSLCGCSYEGPLSAARCAADADCSSGTCVDGYCIDSSQDDGGLGDPVRDVDCAPEQIVCDDQCVDHLFDNDNCGGCDLACTGASRCAQGRCVPLCDEGLIDCDGTCRDLESDPDHCGSCDNACPASSMATAVCIAGSCEVDCDETLDACGHECVDHATDPEHCGGCGQACDVPDNGRAICVDGTCETECAASFDACQQQCVNYDTDVEHCGGCGQACPDAPEDAVATCTKGWCGFECRDGLDACDDACVDVDSDPNNCGGCGIVCGDTCSQGKCVPLPCDPKSDPFGGGSGTQADPHTICSPAHLEALADDHAHQTKHFVLSDDIDMSGVAIHGIGHAGSPFEGSFFGDNRKITNLTLDDDGRNQLALFGEVSSGATVGYVHLDAVEVFGSDRVAALVARNHGWVVHAHVSGTVEGHNQVGGLVGRNEGTVSSSTAAVDVSGREYVGGLVGYNRGSLVDSSASGDVTSSYRRVGGLVGFNNAVNGSCDIVRCHARGAVTVDGSGQAGGLVGMHRADCEIRESFASGEVTGTVRDDDELGGLVGRMAANSRVRDSYATGQIDANDELGGLVGRSSGTNDEIIHSYSTGSISGDDNVGGLIGQRAGAVDDSYWNTDTSNLNSSAGGDPLDATEFADPTSFQGWDFHQVWRMSSGDGRPRLRWE